MTLRLYFLRHARAAPRVHWIGDDASRPLTPEGLEAIRAGARGIVAMKLGLDAVVTSPLVRARATAEVVAEACGLSDRLEVDDRLAHGFDAGRLRKIVAAHPGATALMVVGHEPEFSATVAELIGGGEVVFKKGGLARVDAEGPELKRGRLVWLLTPSQLAKG